jgi:hypothetical protein
MLLKIGIIAGVLAFCLISVVSLAVYQSGFLIVNVRDQETGKHFLAPVPMFAINLAMEMIPDYRLQRFSANLPTPALQLERAGKNLLDCPDGVFVEIDNQHDHVRVEKRNGNMILSANTPDKNVFIQVPIASTTRALARIVQVSESQSKRE